MPLDENQADKLAALIEALRPQWQAVGVKAQLARVAGRNPFDVAHAALRAAEDPGAVTPGVIPTPGPHWSGSRAEVTPRGPRRDQECRRHVGEFAQSCGPCGGERRGGNAWYDADDTPAPLPADQARELCRRIAQRVKGQMDG